MQLTKIRDLTTPEMKSIRDGFGEGFLCAGKKHPDVVGLSADLAESIRMHKFAEEFPNRFFQTGIAEQNMAGVAAGLALSGKIPYIGSFANFSPGRNFDQIRTSVCMMNANVKIASSHAGFSYGEDGITVQMCEDIAMMRALPNMKVIVPADAMQACYAAESVAAIEGPVYLRLGRAETPLLFTDDIPFELGKAQLIREGTDIAIIACGYMVFRSLLAADILSKQGIQAKVINMHTIKPLDLEAINEAASTGAIVTAEEAQINGGLGDGVAAYLARTKLIPVEMVAVMDQFGGTGKAIELSKSRHIMEEDIVAAAMKVFSRKTNNN